MLSTWSITAKTHVLAKGWYHECGSFSLAEVLSVTLLKVEQQLSRNFNLLPIFTRFSISFGIKWNLDARNALLSVRSAEGLELPKSLFDIFCLLQASQYLGTLLIF
jgi:hypothetical protein